MTHKVHPKIFRIENIFDWESRWMSKKNLPQYLEEDFKIRSFVQKKLKEAGIEAVEIERFANKVSVIINTSRPGLVIGRGGAGAELLKKEMEKTILRQNGPEKRELRIEIREVKNPWTSASLVSQWMAQQLEKRMPYRKVAKQTIEKVILNKEVKGVRAEVSGRLDGRTISSRDWFQKGQLPRQTLRAHLDFGRATAFCSYGAIGVKIWIYKGEEFGNKGFLNKEKN